MDKNDLPFGQANRLRVEILTAGQKALSSNLWSKKYPESEILLFRHDFNLASSRNAAFRFKNIFYFPYEVSEADYSLNINEPQISADLRDDSHNLDAKLTKKNRRPRIYIIT